MAKRRAGRNREDGHQWECDVAKDLRNNGYPLAVTARSANRRRDAEGIDIVNSDEFANGRMLDDIQAKSTTSIPWNLLLELEKSDKGSPKRRKVLAVKLAKMITTKSDKRQKVTQAKLAVILWRDYLRMLAIVKKCEQLQNVYTSQDPVWQKPLFQGLLDLIENRDGHA